MSASSKQKSVVWPGEPYPLGATWDGQGVNFALFSENAEKVELCLFDPGGEREVERVEIREQTDQIWHCYLPYGRLGQLYGFRVYGHYDPASGHRFNPNKLLLDPYAKATVGAVDWSYPHFAYRLGAEEEDLAFDERDNAAGMPKCRVVDTAFTWGDDRPPRIPWHETIIYETHVKGFTKRHPGVPPALRGTYAGLASAPAIEHLKRLGVTAVELMPVHCFVDDKHLVDRGLRNYWGYNSIGFFGPDMRYSATGSISEFKTMVKRLHSAGLEVILDVVYNHTAEGNHLGPTLSFRGIDNAAYYRLVPDDPRYYMDFTGTGNTLNMRHPRVLQLIMDSLRYWILEMHVDGFRFDLASALARELYEVDQLSSFFTIIHQDPVISQAKLIAEPWDVGEGGYQVGNFPAGWAEWNGKYRDAVRAYWKGEGGRTGELAYRLTGSSDLYEQGGRKPHASINFVTAHDGFTLRDLVSYDEKHNEANGEDNNDGESHNLSHNFGVEGPTDDLNVRRLRARQRRNFMATLLLSQGVPMILSGDELGRTQAGNNNAYCQDNEISWLDWNLSSPDRNFLAFVRRMIRLRAEHPVFRRRRFFQGRELRGVKDVTWLTPDGREMTDEEWGSSFVQSLGFHMSGLLEGEYDSQGRPEEDDDFLLFFNASDDGLSFQIPAVPEDARWEIVMDTSYYAGLKGNGFLKAGDEYALKARSMAVLIHSRQSQYLDEEAE
ncbi:MAG TPA: glycogen debranching protein GlgX [Rubrobacteraceae bacterium]|nr:glycogen debranching protein GlgX [Rubrobacteraceae bacterium]